MSYPSAGMLAMLPAPPLVTFGPSFVGPGPSRRRLVPDVDETSESGTSRRETGVAPHKRRGRCEYSPRWLETLQPVASGLSGVQHSGNFEVLRPSVRRRSPVSTRLT